MRGRGARLRGLVAAAAALAAALLTPHPAAAQVVLDGSLGPAGQVPSGDFLGTPVDYLISDDLGLVRGQNLFHSFDRFDLDAGEIALFTDTQLGLRAQPLRNILARVTGGPSSIDGLLASYIPNAALFFLNPNGIVFGPNAQLDVLGSFHVSTADFLRFDSGEDFEATASGSIPMLESAEPAAFGFTEQAGLALAPAPITFEGAKLSVPEGEDLAVVGGNLELVGGASLTTGEGRITLVSVASPGLVVIGPGDGAPDLQDFDTLGEIHVEDSDVEIVSNASGQRGTIVVRGAKLRLDGGTLHVEAARDVFDPDPDPGIDMVLTEDLDARDDSSVSSETTNAAAAGCFAAGAAACRAPDVEVTAPRVRLTNSEIAARSLYDGGAVRVSASERLVVEGPGSRLSSSNWPDAPAFTEALVHVVSPDVTIDDHAAVQVLALAPGLPAGRIVIEAGPDSRPSELVISGISRVDAFGPELLGVGDSSASSGLIEISGYDTVSVDRSRVAVSTMDSLGPGGVEITDVGSVSLTDRAMIDAEASVVLAPAVSGTIIIDAGSVALSGNSRISSAANNYGFQPGFGGAIVITTDGDVVLDGSADDPDLLGTQILGSLFDFGAGSGAAGAISVDAANVRLSDGAAIRTDASFLVDVDTGEHLAGLGGASGTIDVDAANEITLEGGAEITSTANSLIELPDGFEGDVSITADRLQLDGESAITSNATGFGLQGRADAGTVSVLADEVSLTNGSRIGTESIDAGHAGAITVRGRDGGRARLLELSGGSRIDSESSVAFADTSGDAGSIDVAADRVVLEGRSFGLQTALDSSAADFGRLGRGGAAGSIFIRAETVDVGGGALVKSESSTSEEAGSVEIIADESVTIAGFADQIDPDTGSPFEQPSAVSSSGLGAGGGGSVIIRTPVLLVDGAQITASSFGAFLGPGQDGGGDAGSVLLEGIDGAPARRILIRGNGLVRSETWTKGQGGDVTLRGEDVVLQNQARVSSLTAAEGAGGDVKVTADSLRIISDEPPPGLGERGDEAGISASSREGATGDAGDVAVTARVVEVTRGSISARASGASKGGNIDITVDDLLLVEDQGQIVANVETADDANITIGDPKGVVLRDGAAIIAQAEEPGGFGGRIEITSDTFFASPDSVVSASAVGGPEFEGEVVIRSPVVNIEAGINPLQTEFLDPTRLLRPTCAARGVTDEGTFTVAARRGLPVSPEGLLLAYDTMDSLPDEMIAADATLPAVAAPPPGEVGALEEAQVAWNRGAQAFRGGRFEEAGESLGTAAERFAEIGDAAARSDALRGLAQSQQARGEYARSVPTLREALTLAEGVGDQRRIAAAMGGLANAQLALGRYDEAEKLMRGALIVAKNAGHTDVAATLLNNLGNQQAARKNFADAVSSYEESARLAAAAGERVEEAKALSNGARAALEAGQPARAQALLARASERARKLPEGHAKLYVLIHLARSHQELARVDPGRRRAALTSAYAALGSAIELARTLGDTRAESYAIGNLGSLYQGEGRLDEALFLTQNALRLSEQALAPESSYRWHWQAGQIYWAQGRGSAAIRSYRRAVDILEETRQESLSRYDASDLVFRRSVEPVYLDLVDSLLRGAAMLGDTAEAQRLLLEAQGTVELFKAAELRDYFRDECAIRFEAGAKPLTAVSRTAAVVYPVLLPDRLELLVGFPDRLERYTVDVPSSEIEATAHRLRARLQNPAGVGHLEDSQALYRWLVAPYAAELAEAEVDTLVFVPGGALRTVPLAALHDGEGYLVERFALAVTVGLKLPDPQRLDVHEAEFVLAGVSESVQGFEPLPAVRDELGAIQDLYGGRVLLDEDFELDRLEEEVTESDPSVVHLATHAVFRGDPQDSFLITHDERLTMDRLADLVGRTRYRDQPLELLTLSACETAAGDERAALGLAGVAIRAGARSALGSLWSISDEATYQLILEFYEQIGNPGVSKAEALRRAQRKLLASEEYAHPYYWSAFLLISNWM